MKKMIMAVIPRDEAEQVLDALINAGHTATFSETKGGMLRQSQYTLFIAVEESEVDKVCQVIQSSCTQSVPLDDELESELNNVGSARVGGAIVFIWEIAKVETY
ncbi:MAG TPA: hypothetical protein DCK95_03705 [Anaerolineaceae bacterium]|nr:hypothetical protein [Anaerolineaceae bacterium]